MNDIDANAVVSLGRGTDWIRALDLLANPRLAPMEPGLYGWWFNEPPGDTPVEDAAEREGFHWLYVGVAGARPSSRRTLRGRLANHLRSPIRTSTLRRTLSVLLCDELGLQHHRRADGKVVLLDEGEGRLTLWMTMHMRVAMVPHPEPRRLEHFLIQGGAALPLNIQCSAHAFAGELRRRRAALFVKNPIDFYSRGETMG